ncbi:putative surface protein with fasciclin (FAS1) repeats [Haloferula luteola]|uniref:Putative surface protein with fasciclin (FAS1) repeats n=1 Tax=Haloferula luteola TaxID=595692 RepID=A0A840VGF3_9BACT|nr:fasciclin domain-containing protein [Haloferula luteola]MBB5351871.1 putative surface protein with fasciclin (FAS1) repeats [Haloferula luteola]
MKLTELALMLAIPVAGPAALAADGPENPKASTPMTEAAVTKESDTVLKAIEDGTTFQVLTTAIKAAGLEEDLAKAGAITVFAPTDEAFRKLPEGTLTELLAPENKLKLRQLLLSHVFPGKIMAASMKDTEIKAMSGDLMEIDVDGTTVELEESKVVNADIQASNGVIHVIDKVAVPKALDGFAKLDEE